MTTESVYAIRAMNICRMRHKPTYVALRALLDDDEFDTHSNTIAENARHKLMTKRKWRYFTYPMLKEVNNGDPIYRSFTIGSPFTLIAESLCLSLLSKEKAFQKNDYVYSYLWPTSANSGHNYSFYRYGYLQRNDAVKKALTADESKVAVINDIRSFYPSIDWAELELRVNRRLGQIEDTQIRHIAQQFIGSFQDTCRKGLAVGPDLSHILADIALEHVDAAMSKRWPKCYFRYVDDIIVVCKPAEVNEVQTTLKDLLSPLVIHDGKQDVVPSHIWHQHCPSITRENSLSSFGGLTRAIELMMLHSPHKSASLESRFLENGFSIPFRRLAVGTRYGRFERFLKWILSANVRLISRLSIAELVGHARNVRSQLTSQVERLCSNNWTTGTQRRWLVQNVRFRINRLLYLFSPEEYNELLKLIPSEPEFDEQRLLVNAVHKNDPLSLLPYPGATVNTYCELMTESRLPQAPQNWPSLSNRAMFESATMFALYFDWKKPLDAQKEMFTGSRVLLNQFSNGITSAETAKEQSYLDEVQLLLRGTDAEKRLEFVRTRMSSREIRGLEAFGLGDSYS